jgi:hypothetical protein
VIVPYQLQAVFEYVVFMDTIYVPYDLKIFDEGGGDDGAESKMRVTKFV